MKILHLKLSKKWFDMISSGEKKEEYRRIKDHWIKRLCNEDGANYKPFDAIQFTNGYHSDSPSMIVKCNGIKIGEPKPEWSDNWQGDVFIINLGEILQPI